MTITEINSKGTSHTCFSGQVPLNGKVQVETTNSDSGPGCNVNDALKFSATLGSLNNSQYQELFANGATAAFSGFSSSTPLVQEFVPHTFQLYRQQAVEISDLGAVTNNRFINPPGSQITPSTITTKS